jgi:hypothetical protein
MMFSILYPMFYQLTIAEKLDMIYLSAAAGSNVLFSDVS